MAHKGSKLAQRLVLHRSELIPIECRSYRLREQIATLVEDVRLRFSSERILPIAGFLEVTIRALGEAQTHLAQGV